MSKTFPNWPSPISLMYTSFVLLYLQSYVNPLTYESVIGFLLHRFVLNSCIDGNHAGDILIHTWAAEEAVVRIYDQPKCNRNKP